MMTSMAPLVDRRMQLGCRGCRDAVVGPEHLVAIGHGDCVVRLPAGMLAGEGRMVRRVPVLRRERMLEAVEQPVDNGDDGVAVRDGQLSTRHEGGLDVDQPQDVILHRHSTYSGCRLEASFRRLYRNHKNLRSLRVNLPACFLIATALAIAAVATPAAAVTFRWANDGDVNAMDPATRQETVQLSFLGNIYEPLVRRNRDLALEPSLATAWEQTSPTVWRFHLRPGVKWQDGSAFSADDVVFTLHRILSKNSQMRAPLSPVREARKIDDLTVEFETFHAGSDLPARARP